MSGAHDSALVSLIKQRREALLQSSAGANEQVVFLDNRLTPTPECILRDPVLNPYDKILWQGILAVAQSEGGPPGTLGAGTAMPTYDALSQLVHVSRMSIATSIAALRATRWLIVNQLRDQQGTMRGQLYVIAYTPWDLSQALDIDDHYIDWLETQTEERRDRRIWRIAQAVWDTITEDRRNGLDITAPVDPIQKTLDASKALTDQSGRFYAIGVNALKQLTRRQAEADKVMAIDRDDGSGEIEVENHSTKNRQVRNSYSVDSVDEQSACSNSDRIAAASSSSSSKYLINKNTTTSSDPAELAHLEFPPRLRPLDTQRIAKVLAGLLPDQTDAQQLLLDELGGRIEWGQGFRGNVAAWFKGMVQNYLRLKQEFIPNYAEKYKALREQRAVERPEETRRNRPHTDAEKRVAQAALEQMRQHLPGHRSHRTPP